MFPGRSIRDVCSNCESVNSDLFAFLLSVTLVHLPSSISMRHRDVTLMTMRTLGLGNDVFGLGFNGSGGIVVGTVAV